MSGPDAALGGPDAALGGGERSLLEQEILEQPSVLARRRASTEEHARAAGRVLTAEGVSHVVIAARGSSDNAARYAQYLFGSQLRLATYLAAPSLFADGRGTGLDGAAVLGISQSGQSPDVVAVLLAARAQDRPTVAVTNDPSSPLAAAADVVVPLMAGAERSVAATKSYTATLAALVQITAAAGADQLRDGLDRLPELVGTAIDECRDPTTPPLDPAAGSILAGLTTVGRGTGYATAAETALKIREVAGVRAESYALPDLLHGPIAANLAGSEAWVIASPSYPVAYWEQLAARMTAEGVRVTAVAGERDVLSAYRVLRLPRGLPPWLFDLVAVVPGQVAALRLGEARGLDVDAPRGLAKVTRTR